MKQALIKLHVSVFLAGFTGVLGALIQLNGALLVWYRIMLTVITLFAWLSLKKKDNPGICKNCLEIIWHRQPDCPSLGLLLYQYQNCQCIDWSCLLRLGWDIYCFTRTPAYAKIIQLARAGTGGHQFTGNLSYFSFRQPLPHRNPGWHCRGGIMLLVFCAE